MNYRAVALGAALRTVLASYSPTADAARRKPLADPPKISLPCQMTLETMDEITRRVLVESGWGADAVGSGVIRGIRVHNNKHRLVVLVRFGSGFYDVDYSSSINLNYQVKDGVRQIHPAANEWMRSLDLELEQRMLDQCALETSARQGGSETGGAAW